jgi:hypothetical protein
VAFWLPCVVPQSARGPQNTHPAGVCSCRLAPGIRVVVDAPTVQLCAISLAQLELETDVETFFRKGDGLQITQNLSCILLEDMFQQYVFPHLWAPCLVEPAAHACTHSHVSRMPPSPSPWT